MNVFKVKLYGFLIVLLVVLFSLPLTAFPRYNIVKFPQYWPQEIINQITIVLVLTFNLCLHDFPE